MSLLLASLALLIGCINPTSFRCDNSTGEDCDAGAGEVKDAGVDLAGTWSLRVVLEPRPDAGGRLTMPLTANVEQVKLVATAGGWRMGVEVTGAASTCPRRLQPPGRRPARRCLRAMGSPSAAPSRLAVTC